MHKLISRAAGDTTEMEIQDKAYWRNALQSALDDCGMFDALTPKQLDKAAESLAARVKESNEQTKNGRVA